MKIYNNPAKDKLAEILQRPSYNHSKIEKIVTPILERVARGGDRALKKYALEYDHVELDDLWVDGKTLENAEKEVPAPLRKSIELAKENIWKFHEAQKVADLEMEVMPGVVCKRKSVPIEKVGLYVPGGTAPLFSTVLMLGIPAKIAGCKEIIMASPTNKLGKINPVVLFTANLLGIKRILKLGGAQAVAALAYGSETVPKVDKIFGPGNQYVTAAKQLVARDQVAIDMPAGPSEVMVIVDDKAKSSFAAADLLSQAEHGVDSQVVLVSTSEKKAKKIIKRVNQQLEDLPRKSIAAEVIKKSPAIIAKRESLVDIINEYSPEHLILSIEKPNDIIDGVINAGSIFIGKYTPESVGDYASGTNHTLPTDGWAKAFSGVSLDSFVKKITYQEVTKEGLQRLGPVVEEMAQAEQLHAHKNAVSIRLKSLSK